jgi:SAM-dependent methyltransferase
MSFCRFCQTPLNQVVMDLGSTAVSNAFLTKEEVDNGEGIYPLKAYVCGKCFLVQVSETRKREDLFTPTYVYSSSISKSWLDHCKQNVLSLTERFKLNASSLVVEVASNDGYLLQFFKEKGIPCLGIEPTLSTAAIAREKGIETVVEFFDLKLAEQLCTESKQADILIGNNVLAHVPDINFFVAGLKALLKPSGVIVFEFPHLSSLLKHQEFDTIYHEHYSYFSLFSVRQIFLKHGLKIFDVEKWPTHGGSLRIFAAHEASAAHQTTERLQALEKEEANEKIKELTSYAGYQAKFDEVKHHFLKFCIEAKLAGKQIAGFGAAAKGNTFLNYAGIRKDLIDFVVDDTPMKQGKFLPQSHIPVFAISELEKRKPDYIVILPWNFRAEISEKLQFTKKWGAQLVVYIPKLEIF